MKMIFQIAILLLFTTSCVYIHKDDSIDLGNQYRYIQEVPQAIIYHPTPKYEGGGVNVVPPKVVNYKFNDTFIIAKSVDFEDDKIKYWIINKQMPEKEVKPLDSLSFYERLEIDKIDLKF